MEEKNKNGKNSDRDIEEIAIDVIKLMLSGNVPLEDIQHITGKSIDEIKRIGGIED